MRTHRPVAAPARLVVEAALLVGEKVARLQDHAYCECCGPQLNQICLGMRVLLSATSALALCAPGRGWFNSVVTEGRLCGSFVSNISIV
jgi:hypothetical protein